MSTNSTREILERALIHSERPLALHQQVREFLREAIHEHFEDGQSFWTEMLLMEQLGVSRGTVRQALAELTREGLLVREASRRTFVRKSAVSSIGLVFSRIQSDFVIELQQRVAATCLERNLHLELYPLLHPSRIEEVVTGIRHSPQEERLILLGAHEGADKVVQECLTSKGYRAVIIEAMKPNYGFASVATDDAAAVQLAVEHLRELGHSRIAFMVNEPVQRLSVRRKIEEFEQLCQLYDLDGRIISGEGVEANSSFEVGYKSMARIWEVASPPTAIFTASDPGAWAALRYFAERKIEVPAQVSVVGFEGVKPDAFTHPPLTTVAHALDELVARVFELLWEKEMPLGAELIAPRIVVRQSTAPPPRSPVAFPQLEN